MTSSYGSIIGTPEDEIPDISDTNYMKTEANMEAAVNENVDDNIKDTKEFYDGMIEIEKNRQDILNKRLRSIKEITGYIDDITTILTADDLEKSLNEYKKKKSRALRNEIVNHSDNEQTYSALHLSKIIKDEEDPRRPEIQDVLNQLNYDVDPDGDIKTFFAKYTDKALIGSIYSTSLNSLGHGSLTNAEDGANYRDWTDTAIRVKIHTEAIKAGFDINSPKYEKWLLKLVQPVIDSQRDKYQVALDSQIQTNINAAQKESIDDKIRISALSINISKENGQDLTTFNDPKFSLIKAISVAPSLGFNGDMGKATDYYFDQIKTLLDGNEISIADGEAILNKLPFYHHGTKKTYSSYREYAESLDPTDKHYFKVHNRIKLIDDAIESKYALQATDEGKAHAKLQRPYKKKVDDLYALAARQNRKVRPEEVFKLIQEYYGDENLYVAGHSIKGIKPKWLTDLETQADYLGDKNVDVILKNKNLINSFEPAITREIALYKKKAVNQLDANDMFLASILKDELTASLIAGDDPSGLSDFDIFLNSNNNSKLFVQNKLNEIVERLKDGEFDADLATKGTRLAYAKEDLKELHLKSKGSTFDSPEIYEAEKPFIEKTILHIKSGGRLYPEMIKWWGEFNIKDEDGTRMKPRELMYKRLTALGVFKEEKGKGFYIDPKRKFLTKDEIKYEDTNGLIGSFNLMTKESSINGETNAKNFLDMWEYEESKEGATDSQYTGTGYNFFKRNSKTWDTGIENFGYGLQTKILKGLGLDGEPQLTKLSVYDPNDAKLKSILPGNPAAPPRSIWGMAKLYPEARFGRYGIKGSQLTELFETDAFKKYLEKNPATAFDDNFQDFLAFEWVRYQLNTKNSIRGMKIVDGKLSITDLTVFSEAEVEAMKEIFPRLADYKFSHLNMLSKPIADIILTKLEQAQKLDEEEGGDKNVKAYRKEQRGKKVREFFSPINPMQQF